MTAVTDRLVFVHVPKTAGTAITHALRPLISPADWGRFYVNRGHHLPRQLMSLLPHWEQTYRWTMVRNPLDRIASLYRYKRHQPPRSRQYGHREAARLSLSDWTRWLLTDEHQDYQGMLGVHQWAWVTTGVHVYYYEDGPQRVLDRVADCCGMPRLEVPWLLRRPRSGSFDDDAERLVRTVCRRDFRQFNYK